MTLEVHNEVVSRQSSNDSQHNGFVTLSVSERQHISSPAPDKVMRSPGSRCFKGYYGTLWLSNKGLCSVKGPMGALHHSLHLL